MKNIKEKQKLIIMSMVTTAVIVISLFSTNNDQTLKTSVNVGSSKTIGWGIKRAKNNMQPDVGTDNKKMLEENSGICLGNDMEKVIYLTFDEGYEAGYTEKILNTLKKNDVKATFFITSHYFNTASDLVERMISDGHIIGNHTVNHKSLPSISNEEIDNELMKLHQEIY